MIITLALSLLMVSSSQEPALRTSPFEQGYCILSQNQDSGPDKGMDHIYLARKNNDGLQKIIQLPTLRYERDEPDKIYVSDNQILVLVCGPATRYIPVFIQKERNEYKLLDFPIEGMYFGSSSAIIIDKHILGTVWISPDVSEASGNYLYMFDSDGLKAGLLPGKEEGYFIEKKDNRTFKLTRWFTYRDELLSSYHKLPISIQYGYWELNFRKASK